MSAHKSPHVAPWPLALDRVPPSPPPPPPSAPVLTSSNSSEAGAKFAYVHVMCGLCGVFKGTFAALRMCRA